MEFLFGLDMLKRHLCVIDLREGVLALGSAGAKVPFLSEKDLPSSARETRVSCLLSLVDQQQASPRVLLRVFLL